MADDKTTKTPEQPVTDSGPGKETPPAPPKEPEKVSVSPELEKKTEPEVKNPQVSVYNFAEIMKEKKVEERAAAPGVEKPDPAKAEKPEKQPEAPKKAEEKPKEPEQPKRRGRPPKADKDKDPAPKSKAPAQKPEKAVKKEPEKKTAPTVQTAPAPKEPEKPKDAPRRAIKAESLIKNIEDRSQTEVYFYDEKSKQKSKSKSYNVEGSYIEKIVVEDEHGNQSSALHGQAQSVHGRSR